MTAGNDARGPRVSISQWVAYELLEDIHNHRNGHKLADRFVEVLKYHVPQPAGDTVWEPRVEYVPDYPDDPRVWKLKGYPHGDTVRAIIQRVADRLRAEHGLMIEPTSPLFESMERPPRFIGAVRFVFQALPKPGAAHGC